MTKAEQSILISVRNSLGIDLLTGTIIYLNINSVHKGEQVKFGDVIINVPWDAELVFVDLEPIMNWGHECCYLLIRKNADEVIRIEARMPPSLKDSTSTFRLLWRGDLAPEWAVMTNEN